MKRRADDQLSSPVGEKAVKKHILRHDEQPPQKARHPSQLSLQRAFSISTLHTSLPLSSLPTSYAPSGSLKRTSFREAEKRIFTPWKERRQHQEADREVGELRNSSAEGQSIRRTHERKYRRSVEEVSRADD